MDINGPYTTLKLYLEGVGLTLLGSGGDEEAGVENDRIVGADDAHFPEGKSIIECGHPCLVPHGGRVPIVEKLASGGDKKERENIKKNQQFFGGHLNNII